MTIRIGQRKPRGEASNMRLQLSPATMGLADSEWTDSEFLDWPLPRWQRESALNAFKSWAQPGSLPTVPGAAAWPRGTVLAILLIEILASGTGSILPREFTLAQRAPQRRVARVLSSAD